jgi:ribosomal protein S18 acetylase RimI-like enzyme
MSDVTLAIEPYSPEALAAIGDGLRDYNDGKRPKSDRTEFVVTVRGDDGTILGGAKCRTGEGILFIEWLWVDDAVRGGTGTQVMAMAEAHAMSLGCTRAYLDTFNFQARGFYEKLGYVVFGTLPYPRDGVERFYMVKDLKPSTSTPS